MRQEKVVTKTRKGPNGEELTVRILIRETGEPGEILGEDSLPAKLVVDAGTGQIVTKKGSK